MDLELLSGEFTGYYSYDNQNDPGHEMRCSLVFFQDGRIIGHGVDDVDPFHFEGKVNLQDKSVSLMKKYPTHQVQYTGSLTNCQNSISINGLWSIPSPFKTAGRFTLKKGHSQASIMADINAIEQKLKQQLTVIKEWEL